MKEKRIKKLVKRFFKLEGKPLRLSDSQATLASLIVFRCKKRVHVIAPTQYGKSSTVAVACLFSAVIYGEPWIICAPSQNKADIIMQHVIDHLDDNPLFQEMLELDYGDTVERLKSKKSKKHLTFKNGASIRTLTLDAKNGKRSIEAAMGSGGKNIILDESALIDDKLHATVVRMLGGYGDEGFLLEIGNPFYRNHFFKDSLNERYEHFFIDYKKALEEGRFTEEFIEEMRDKPFFDVFYECKFPDEEAIDADGYRQLLTYAEVENAQVETGKHTGTLRLGEDVGGGGDRNVYVIRSDNYAEIESENQSNDTMTNVAETERIQEQNDIKDREVYIDDIGVGRGVTDRLKEKRKKVNAVTAGGKAVSDEFTNIKAENYWALREWVKKGGKLRKSPHWQELTWIKYKVDSAKKIKIEPKDKLKKRTGKSPDHAEALMLTFTQQKPDVILTRTRIKEH